VGILAGYTQAGYFSAAEKLTRAMIGVLGPVTQTVFPHISVLVGQSRDMAMRFLRKSLAWIAVLSFIPSALLLVFARPIALVLFASRAEGSVSTLRWIALLPFALAISSIFAIQTMIPFGLEKQLSRIYIFAGFSSLACAIPAISRFGSPGAGACLMGVEIVVIGLMWVVLKRHGIDLLHSASPYPAGQVLS
jgi:PST family polysaccharide transporter